MSIQDDHELTVTREKLRLLEERVAVVKNRETENARVRELTLRSLMRLVKQLREEIIRYTVGAGARSKG